MRARIQSARGFSVAELLIASAIMLTVTGAVFTLMNPSVGTFRTQPEVSDLQQRLRVGTDALNKDLLMAGGGTYMGPVAGALYNFFAPVVPYRLGMTNNDPTSGIFFRAAAGNPNASDTISFFYVPPSMAQTTISNGMPAQSSELKVNAQPFCGPNKKDQLCGFEEGIRVMIWDASGSMDFMTITHVQPAALHLQHNQDKLSKSYEAGSVISQIAMHTYYLKTDIATNTHQLRHYDGFDSDLPIVDDVVKLEFEYFGDPRPPIALPNKSMADPVGPWTTYGPKPPVIGVDNNQDSWGAGENCVFSVQGGQHVSRLPALSNGLAQVQLTQAMLTDGPWCPDAASALRFDADLLRVRRVRVKVRAQAPAALRGPAGVLFKYGGTSTAANQFVPDQEFSFDVTPRNLNLGR
jgi:hypothetical protein